MYFMNREYCASHQQEIFSCLNKTVPFYSPLRRHTIFCQNILELLLLHEEVDASKVGLWAANSLHTFFILWQSQLIDCTNKIHTKSEDVTLRFSFIFSKVLRCFAAGFAPAPEVEPG